MSKFEQHDKLAARKEEHEAVCAFLEWLTEEKGRSIIRWGDSLHDVDRFQPRKLISEYFEIDEEAFEQEKRTMLAVLSSSARRSKP